MKTFSKLFKLSWMIVLSLGLIITSCSKDDEEKTVAPVASFQFEVDETTGLEVTFTNYSKDAASYAWDFGDGTGTSNEANPVYSYTLGGTYTVVLTVTNSAGTAEHSKEVTVEDKTLPVANFTFAANPDNTLEVTFTDNSENAASYAWDFGDGSGTSTDANPTYTFTSGGTYSVTLTVTNANGATDAMTKDVTAVSPEAVNLIANGEFDDDSVWAILQHNPNNNAVVTIANGVCNFNDIEQGAWGTEGHAGINQVVEVEAGNYQLDLNITTNGINEMWFEVWIGTQAPVDGEEYNDANGAVKVLSFNAWNCYDAINTYSGPMAAVNCEELDGSISLDSGSYYVVIRTGGITWGDDGITIDNVTMFKVD